MPRPRPWTDDQLAHAVAASSTLSEVCRRIGIRPGRYDLLRAHITRIGADASHLPNLTPRPPRRPRRADDHSGPPPGRHLQIMLKHVAKHGAPRLARPALTPAPPAENRVNARIRGLVTVLRAAGLSADQMSVEADIVTVTAPHSGGVATVTTGVDEHGPFWQVRRYDSRGTLDMSAQLHDGHGVATFLTRTRRRARP